MPTTYAIPNGATVMAATTYNGNSSSQSLTNTVNSTSFQPDLVWVKKRSAVANHYLWDSVRGALKEIYSNLTNAETTNTIGLSSFNSNGFTLNNGDSAWNASGSTYVAWQWQAGQGTTSSNTNGSITSTVSVNATAGFSVVTYTHNGVNAATVGHGLGVAPKFIINKQRSAASNWRCYHSSLPAGYNIQLNLTQAQSSAADIFPTAPTSTVFTPGNGDSANGVNFVAYCWAEVAGFSKFGSYTGNGSTDGPFVYCGFRPRYVMMKRTDNVGDWWIYDTARSTYNAAIQYLFADTSGAEVTDASEPIDFLSNGFKLRIATYQPNTSGATFIYAAFAENPFKYANAR
jgi:hypothetical protein